MTQRSEVAIIGAGFSGLLTALHLLRKPQGPAIRLVERRGAFARGAAYSTLDPDHLLNVRASNMSAFPDDPPHFVEWLSRTGHDGGRSQFVRRRQYGDYLQALIQDAMEAAPAGRLLLEPDAAVALDPEDGSWRITLEMGRSFRADAVILALGNLPPTDPASFTVEAAQCAAYIADPWSLDAGQLPKTGTAVLLGSGLSMIDVAIHIERLRPDLRMLALSRRGLLPRRHLDEGPAPAPRAEPWGRSPLDILREIRRGAETDDWRAVLDGLRPHVHTIWKTWSTKDRGRFLRHVRPWWDVHRHRLAPPVAAKLDHLIASGKLRAEAGRIVSVGQDPEGLEITWRARGASTHLQDRAAVVINCAGPNGDPARSDDPLLRGLVARGLTRPDRHKLGLDVDDEGRLIGDGGHISQTLFAVGPLTRGAFWEITSVPDIRVQALKCADTVAASLAQT